MRKIRDVFNAKKYISIILSVIMVVSIGCLSVFANDNSDIDIPTPRDSCPNCQTGIIYPVCKRNSVYDGRMEHKYSGGTCRVDCYRCYGQYQCVECGYVREQINFLHACFKYHIDCGKDYEYVCTYHPPV